MAILVIQVPARGGFVVGAALVWLIGRVRAVARGESTWVERTVSVRAMTIDEGCCTGTACCDG